ncbi:protein RER1, partial [Mycena filopes]
RHGTDSCTKSAGSIYPRPAPVQQLLDRWTPYTLNRWIATAGLFAVFILRIIISQGWYIVCFVLAIYLLNFLLAFLQPKFDPSLQELTDDGGDKQVPAVR